MQKLPAEKKSKSQIKREMLELQVLGEQLVKLNKDQLKKIPLDDLLRKEILFTQSITSHGALRRQLQYIGRLMREQDPEPIQKALATLFHPDRQALAKFHELEKWRDRLLTEKDEETLREFLTQYPKTDSRHLQQLIHVAKQESLENKSPKARRILFRYLREITEEK